MNRPFFTQTLTGTPIVGYQDGPLYEAQFSRPYGITYYDHALLIVDRSEPTSIRRVTESKVSSVKWINHSEELLHPTGITVLRDTIFIADRGHDKVRYILNSTGELKTLVIDGLHFPSQVAAFNGDLLILDQTSLYRAQLGFTSTEIVVEGIQRLVSGLAYPDGLAVHCGAIFVANTGKHQILRLGLDDEASPQLFAGSGPGFEDGPVLSAKFRYPAQLCAIGDAIFVSDRDNQVVRMIRNGVVTSLSQGGARGYQNGAFDVSKFNEPAGIYGVLKAGVAYILVCDCKNACIRCLSNGRFSTADAGECLNNIFSMETDTEAEEQNFCEETENSSANNELHTSNLVTSTTSEPGRETMSAKNTQNSAIDSQRLKSGTSGVGSALQTREVVIRSRNQDNSEFPLEYAEKCVESRALVSERIKQQKQLPIAPYDALCEVCKVRGFDMAKFHVIMQNAQHADTQPMTDFFNAGGPEFILPLCFGYATYYRDLVLALALKVELDSNMQAVLVLRNFLMWSLSIYRPHIFKRQINSPLNHSRLLARLSSRQICAKIRTSCGGSFLRVTRGGEFRCAAIDGAALFSFEIQVVLCLELRRFDGGYSQFECEVECVSEQLVSKQMYFRLVNEDGFLCGNGKVELRIEDFRSISTAKIAFIVKLRCLDYYKEIPIKITQDAAVRVNQDLPRVMQLQQMYCLSVIE